MMSAIKKIRFVKDSHLFCIISVTHVFNGFSWSDGIRLNSSVNNINRLNQGPGALSSSLIEISVWYNIYLPQELNCLLMP